MQVRGSCTDSSYKSPVCPHFYMGANASGVECKCLRVMKYDCISNLELTVWLDDRVVIPRNMIDPNKATSCCKGDLCYAYDGLACCLPSPSSTFSLKIASLSITIISLAENSGREYVVTSTTSHVSMTAAISNALGIESLPSAVDSARTSLLKIQAFQLFQPVLQAFQRHLRQVHRGT